MNVTTAMLADAARVESGKLFIHGGGWDTIGVPTLPATHPTLALAFIIRVEYDEALTDIPILIELLDEDDHPAGPRMEGMLRTGHGAHQQRGNPTFVSQAITLSLVPFTQAGGYRFRISSNEAELASVPFTVFIAPQLPQANPLG